MAKRQWALGTGKQPEQTRPPLKAEDAPSVARPASLSGMLAQVTARSGNVASPESHAAVIGRATAGRPARAAQTLLQWQRQHGNRHVQRVIQAVRQGADVPMIQAKLTIGPASDQYEQEADRIAKQVIERIHAPAASQPGQAQAARLQRASEEEDGLWRKPMPQRRHDEGGMAAGPELEAAILQARGSGQPLSDTLRRPMEQALGADLSGVRLHTDTQADTLNRSLQARAFTTGQDIFFRQGMYNPGNAAGQTLLAHELTHVVQQGACHAANEGEVVRRNHDGGGGPSVIDYCNLTLERTAATVAVGRSLRNRLITLSTLTGALIAPVDQYQDELEADPSLEQALAGLSAAEPQIRKGIEDARQDAIRYLRFVKEGRVRARELSEAPFPSVEAARFNNELVTAHLEKLSALNDAAAGMLQGLARGAMDTAHKVIEAPSLEGADGDGAAKVVEDLLAVADKAMAAAEVGPVDLSARKVGRDRPSPADVGDVLNNAIFGLGGGTVSALSADELKNLIPVPGVVGGGLGVAGGVLGMFFGGLGIIFASKTLRQARGRKGRLRQLGEAEVLKGKAAEIAEYAHGQQRKSAVRSKFNIGFASLGAVSGVVGTAGGIAVLVLAGTAVVATLGWAGIVIGLLAAGIGLSLVIAKWIHRKEKRALGPLEFVQAWVDLLKDSETPDDVKAELRAKIRSYGLDPNDVNKRRREPRLVKKLAEKAREEYKSSRDAFAGETLAMLINGSAKQQFDAELIVKALKLDPDELREKAEHDPRGAKKMISAQLKPA